MWYGSSRLVAGLCAVTLVGLTGITEQQAQKKALAAVGGGAVRSERETHEAGKLVYQFDINVKGKANVERVNIDASSGKVMGETYEGSQKMKGG